MADLRTIGKNAGRLWRLDNHFYVAHPKLDGKFHVLKVRLANKAKGVSIQARRGYFAPKNKADAEAESEQRDADEREAQIQEQVREVMFTKDVVRDLPVVLYGQRTRMNGQARDISFSMHLDTKPLHFHKDSGRNENTVIFALAIFDQQRHLVASQQRRALVHVPDAQLPSFLKTGIDADMTFNLKPGPYKVRAVVMDSEDHLMAAFSGDVNIP